MNPSRGGAVIGALIVGLLVAGCTGVPGAAPSGSATAKPTSSDAEVDPISPRPALPLTCDELFGLDELQALLEAPVQVHHDETSLPLGVWGAMFDQIGASMCVYGADDRTGIMYDQGLEGYSQGLELRVVPDGAGWYDSTVVTMTSSPQMNTFSEQSMIHCDAQRAASSNGFRCVAGMMVGDYLVQATLSDSVALPIPDAERMTVDVMTTVAERIDAAGSERSLWIPQKGAEASLPCSDMASATVLAGSEISSSLLIGVVAPTRAMGSCTLSGPTTVVTITTLQDGAWAFDEIAATPGMPFHPWLPQGARHEIPRTDGVIVSCADRCFALLSWRGNLVELEFDVPGSDPEIAAARVEAWAAALPPG